MGGLKFCVSESKVLCLPLYYTLLMFMFILRSVRDLIWAELNKPETNSMMTELELALSTFDTFAKPMDERANDLEGVKARVASVNGGGSGSVVGGGNAGVVGGGGSAGVGGGAGLGLPLFLGADVGGDSRGGDEESTGSNEPVTMM